jgi:hypothetical protein
VQNADGVVRFIMGASLGSERYQPSNNDEQATYSLGGGGCNDDYHTHYSLYVYTQNVQETASQKKKRPTTK